MNYHLYLEYAVSIALVLACVEIWSLKHRLKNCRAGQRQWRSVAAHLNSQVAVQAVDKAELKQKALRAERCVARLITFLWGNPPLDRNVDDIIRVIEQLKSRVVIAESTAKGLHAIVMRQNEELSRSNRRAAQREQDLAKAQNELTALQVTVEKFQAILRTFLELGTARWFVVDVQDGRYVVMQAQEEKRITSGDSVEDALEKAVSLSRIKVKQNHRTVNSMVPDNCGAGHEEGGVVSNAIYGVEE